MSGLLKNRLVRKFGIWYLAYEALSFAAFVTFGIHLLPVH